VCFSFYLLQMTRPTPMESSMIRAATDTTMMITTGFCSLDASATGNERRHRLHMGEEMHTVMGVQRLTGQHPFKIIEALLHTVCPFCYRSILRPLFTFNYKRPKYFNFITYMCNIYYVTDINIYGQTNTGLSPRIPPLVSHVTCS